MAVFFKGWQNALKLVTARSLLNSLTQIVKKWCARQPRHHQTYLTE